VAAYSRSEDLQADFLFTPTGGGWLCTISGADSSRAEWGLGPHSKFEIPIVFVHI
jgi:hypothetical protein